MMTGWKAELFPEQSASEQRRLLRVVVDEATWKAGELRWCFREPLNHLRLSNSANATNHEPVGGNGQAV